MRRRPCGRAGVKHHDVTALEPSAKDIADIDVEGIAIHRVIEHLAQSLREGESGYNRQMRLGTSRFLQASYIHPFIRYICFLSRRMRDINARLKGGR